MNERISRAWLALGLVVAAGCANAPTPGSGAELGSSDVARIVCEADGRTSVETPTVAASTEGVHVRVVSRLDEPASVNGWGIDVDPGRSSWVLSQPPGVVQTACWGFSDHDAGKEPPTTPIEVLDPDGLYVDPRVDCAGEVASYIADYAAPGPIEDARIPLDVAGDAIDGLEPTDELVYGGYPEAVPAPVLVVRDGAVVASFDFARFDGAWTSPGGAYCADAGVSATDF